MRRRVVTRVVRRPPSRLLRPPRLLTREPLATAATAHVVQRGETLSKIASSAAGSSESSPEAHSWMLAIYQANPRAFEQNMNVLRTGAVLRMPDSSEVSAVSPAAAATEIRRQYAAWRGGTAPGGTSATAKQSGQLHLVTPSDDSAAPGTGTSASSGEVKALQGRVHDLESQLSESKRLLDIKNAQLGRSASEVRCQLRGAAAAPPPAASTPPPAAQTQAAPPPPAPVEQPPVAQAAPPASTSPPAEEPAAQTTEATPPPPPPAADTSKPAHRPKSIETPASQGGLVPRLFDGLLVGDRSSRSGRRRLLRVQELALAPAI